MTDHLNPAVMSDQALRLKCLEMTHDTRDAQAFFDYIRGTNGAKALRAARPVAGVDFKYDLNTGRKIPCKAPTSARLPSPAGQGTSAKQRKHKGRRQES